MKAAQWDRLLQGHDCGCRACAFTSVYLAVRLPVDLEESEKVHNVCTAMVCSDTGKPLTDEPESEN